MARTQTKETAKLAALTISAHWTPSVISSGAAIGGPRIWAMLAVADSMALACDCCGSGTIAPMTARRDGSKNSAKQLQAASTAYKMASCAPTGR